MRLTTLTTVFTLALASAVSAAPSYDATNINAVDNSNSVHARDVDAQTFSKREELGQTQEKKEKEKEKKEKAKKKEKGKKKEKEEKEKEKEEEEKGEEEEHDEGGWQEKIDHINEHYAPCVDNGLLNLGLISISGSNGRDCIEGALIVLNL